MFKSTRPFFGLHKNSNISATLFDLVRCVIRFRKMIFVFHWCRFKLLKLQEILFHCL